MADDQLDPTRAMKATRKAHRNMLRAAHTGDEQWVRAELYQLYDPHSTPLRALAAGPEPTHLVPVVDAYLMATARKQTEMQAELMDNLQKVGASFGLNATDLSHIQRAGREVSMASTDPGAIERVSLALESTPFGAGCGLTVPSAL